MPRALKTDKFSLTNGRSKGTQYLMLNYRYTGEKTIKLNEILDFLKSKDIDPSKVTLQGTLYALIQK